MSQKYIMENTDVIWEYIDAAFMFLLYSRESLAQVQMHRNKHCQQKIKLSQVQWKFCLYIDV